MQERRRSSPFRRIKSEAISLDPRLADNSFAAKVRRIPTQLLEIASVKLMFLYFKAMVPYPRFHLLIHSYDYNMYVEGLLPANLSLVTLLSLEQCLQFERFHLYHV